MQKYYAYDGETLPDGVAQITCPLLASEDSEVPIAPGGGSSSGAGAPGGESSGGAVQDESPGQKSWDGCLIIPSFVPDGHDVGDTNPERRAMGDSDESEKDNPKDGPWRTLWPQSRVTEHSGYQSSDLHRCQKRWWATSGSGKKCYVCGESGHIAKYCPQNTRKNKSYPPEGSTNQSAKEFWQAQIASGSRTDQVATD